MLRRSLALGLLCVHAAGAAHLALAAHVTTDSGAVVDAQPQCMQQGHGSAGIAHGHELNAEDRDCEIVTLARTAARVTPRPPPAAAPVALPALASLAAASASVPLAVLSVAPKSSPPV